MNRKMTAEKNIQEIFQGLFVHFDGVNAGIIASKSSGIVVNPGTRNLADAIKELGLKRIEKAMFTHHRREMADGWNELWNAFSPQVGVPELEEWLFAKPHDFWDNPDYRWYALANDTFHLPYHVTHVMPLPVSETYEDGDSFKWKDWDITAFSTPGYTDGSFSYLVENGDQRAVFCGDLMYGQGKLFEIYSLQHRNTEGGFTVCDYHGYMGNRSQLIDSLLKIKSLDPTCIIPARGKVVDNPSEAIDLLIQCIQNVYRNYVRTSGLRWYFPDYFSDFEAGKETLKPARIYPLPSQVQPVEGTCWFLKADDGYALLIDPVSEEALHRARQLVSKGTIRGFDAIWITHYHHDHIEAAMEARRIFDCPTITHSSVADVLENPDAYYLTCLSPKRVITDRSITHGESWRWRNYSLTGYHFPGQTYYHAGLHAVSNSGESYFFVGDSLTPTGIDDYCTWNRNFLDEGRGLNYCIELLRELNPHLLFNQHVEVAFSFTDEDYKMMMENLRKRKRLLSQLLPWEDANFGLDEYWVHTYPYSQLSGAGKDLTISLCIYNHANKDRAVTAEFVLPGGWNSDPAQARRKVPAGEEVKVPFKIHTRQNCPPGRYVLPVRITFNGQNLGSFRESIVEIG